MQQAQPTNVVEKGLEDFIFKTKYARWFPHLKRRENWEETVDRVLKMHLKKYAFLSPEDKAEIKWAFSLVKEKKVLPSMRAMQFAGEAIEKTPQKGYNCSVRQIDSIRACAEIGHLMLCGCGTGIGLSNKFVARLPELITEQKDTVLTYTVEDDIEGWADSLEVLLLSYFQNNSFSGRRIVFDYSKIRRKGSLLKTSGGKAPGAKPLKIAHRKIRAILDKLVDDKIKKVRPIHIYDCLMHFADAVLSGGVRRTASSVIFDRTDMEMMKAKTFLTVDKLKSVVDEDDNTAHCKMWIDGMLHEYTFDLNKEKYDYDNLVKNKTISWFYIHPQRARSNNSVLLVRDKTSLEDFKEIFQMTKDFGEPGFVFCNSDDVLFNPCFEIGFLAQTAEACGVQFCNLSSINAKLIQSLDEFLEVARAEAIIGTLQAGYTNFPYLGEVSKQLTEDEALLGCSITGMFENPDLFINADNLNLAAAEIVRVNEIWANKLGIKPAARTTCIKPEGTGSLVIGVQAPGCHPAHSPKFFKRIQISKNDNIYQFFKIYNPDLCEQSIWNSQGTDDVITFPIMAQEGAICKKDINAIQHLEIVKMIQKNWVLPGQKNNKKDIDNSVSCTILVKDDEWDNVINYLYSNKEYFSAVSLLADYGDKLYKQAPFETVTKEQEELFFKMRKEFTNPDYDQLVENYDDTTHTAESSCAGGQCLI